MRNHLPVGALGQRQLWINIHCTPFPASLGLCFTTQTSHRSWRAPGLSSFQREMANTLRKQQVGFLFAKTILGYSLWKTVPCAFITMENRAQSVSSKQMCCTEILLEYKG